MNENASRLENVSSTLITCSHGSGGKGYKWTYFTTSFCLDGNVLNQSNCFDKLKLVSRDGRHEQVEQRQSLVNAQDNFSQRSKVSYTIDRNREQTPERRVNEGIVEAQDVGEDKI